MTEVEFTRDNAPYLAGERATFPASRADVFVAAGVAVKVETTEKTIDPKKTGTIRDYSKKRV